MLLNLVSRVKDGIQIIHMLLCIHQATFQKTTAETQVMMALYGVTQYQPQQDGKDVILKRVVSVREGVTLLRSNMF